MNDKKKSEVTDLMKHSKIVYVSSLAMDGYPNTKAMLYLQYEGIEAHYFSTNLSAKRTQRFMEEPRACIYFCDEAGFKGLMLTGHMQVCRDRAHKEMLWREGFEMYYPKGIDDEDYCVLKFTPCKGNYYHGLENETFLIEEF